ncbi:MAG: M28 family peptidase [Acidobacteriaceae bacterium]|nr:M28 family peptidase [Acidobacteriaceae bacterium]
MTYHAGPGATRVHIKTDYDWTTKPLFDVIATIPGAQYPDQWVLAGNHHDAWVNGADDPVSGAAALLETARSLAALQTSGWKPKRTIKIAFWDGEEFGLLGSTEWAEKHQDELKQKAIVYLNSDSTAKGWIHVSGSHTLEQFATEVASSVSQPGQETNLVYASLHRPSTDNVEEGDENRSSKTFKIGALGAGSDYVAFLDYLGIASMNEGLGGLTKSGIYHSVYDSIYWYEHFSDSDFVDGRALAQYTATALMRLGDGSVLPFEFGHFADTVSGYLDEIGKQAEKSGTKLDFSALRQQLATLKEIGRNYDNALNTVMAKSELDPSRLEKLNLDLMRTERVLTNPNGLPNREWYKHQIYAPGFYTGYGVKTLPGIREAVDSKDWELARKEARVVEECLAQLNQVATQALNDVSGL